VTAAGVGTGAGAVSPAGPGRPGGKLAGLTLVTLERSRPLTGPVAGVAAAVILFLLLQGNGFASTLVVDMLVYAIAAMALDFLGGYTGLISLGQAGFLGVGAYGVAIAEVHFFSPWAAVGISLAVVLALGLALGIVAVRVKGVSFVIITLALGQVLWGLAFQWVGLSEGDNGISVATLPTLGPIDLNDPLTLRMTVLLVFWVVALLLVLLVHSPFGLSLRGVRSNEARLAALGYRTGLHRYLAWVITVFFTGVAGVLYVFVNQLISPSTMDFSANGLFVIMAVLGGLRSIWGPALGAAVIVLFQQELSIYVVRWQTLMGLTLIAVVLFSPGGFWGLVRAAGRRRDTLIARLRARRPAGPAPAGVPPAASPADSPRPGASPGAAEPSPPAGQPQAGRAASGAIKPGETR
jgi:branched-chain amino acid transport system permease protein